MRANGSAECPERRLPFRGIGRTAQTGPVGIFLATSGAVLLPADNVGPQATEPPSTTRFRMSTRCRDDQIWTSIRDEVKQQVDLEPILASFLHATILNHDCLEDALSFHLASKLDSHSLSAMSIRELMDDTLAADEGIRNAIRADLEAVCQRDPASCGYSVPFLYFKGFQALQS